MNGSKKFLVIWAIVGPLMTFLLGAGFIWEWRKTNIESARLDIDRARASYELREKMNQMLLEILKLSRDSTERILREKNFNAAEINLARIEGRAPTIYTFKLPAPPSNLKVVP